MRPPLEPAGMRRCPAAPLPRRAAPARPPRLHRERPALRAERPAAVKDLLDCAGDDAALLLVAKHGVGLAAAGLAIGKDADLLCVCVGGVLFQQGLGVLWCFEICVEG